MSILYGLDPVQILRASWSWDLKTQRAALEKAVMVTTRYSCLVFDQKQSRATILYRKGDRG